MNKTTIQITPELHNFLKNQAIHKDETYDQIIKRILKQYVGVDLEKEKQRTN